MKIKKVIIKNFKSLSDFEINFNKNLNIIVGDNNTGKSTLLEAVNLALTGKLNGFALMTDISPYLFSKKIAQEYLGKVNSKKMASPPSIIVEVYFFNDSTKSDKSNKLIGTQNIKQKNELGIHLEIKLNDAYSNEYKGYISKKINKGEKLKTIPTEYYHVTRRDFSENPGGISLYEKRYLPIFIDTTNIKIQNGNDFFVQNVINNVIGTVKQKDLSIKYKDLKETFSDYSEIKSINKKLTKDSAITNKKMKISLDISSRNSWLRNLVSYIEDIPLSLIGRGEESKIKINLALNKNKDVSDVVLIDEPENHLAFPRLNSLIKNIEDKAQDKQLIIATHSNFITNKLGLKHLILLSKDCKPIALSEKIDLETQDYFMKLSDYDTLRIALSGRIILVEGPSDSLIVQKLFKQKYDKLPIQEDSPVDVIQIKGLAFKRFLNIAKHLNVRVAVITDNDGLKNDRIKNLKEYEKSNNNIKIFTDINISTCTTLEPSLVNTKGNFESIKSILNKESISKERLLEYMSKEKTDVALKIFNSEININLPKYIKLAFEHVRK